MTDAANTRADTTIAADTTDGARTPEPPWREEDRGERPPFSGPGPFVFILILALVGLFASGYLSYRHIALSAEIAKVGDSALCRSSGSINCDAILLTDYALLFDHVPSTAMGFMGFMFVLWCAVNGLVNRKLRKDAWSLLLLYFFAAIPFTGYFLYLMMFQVSVICTWCLVVHGVNVVSLITVLIVAIKKRKRFATPDIATSGERVYFLAGGILLALLSFFVSGMVEKGLSYENVKVRYDELVNDPIIVMAMIKAAPDHDIPITAKDPIFGNPDAPHPIFFFGDFQCPICPKVERFLRHVVSENPQTLSLVYKAYPLSTKCNEYLLEDAHPQACGAARAAMAAFFLGGSKAFFAYGDLLKSNPKLLRQQAWLAIAEKLQLDLERFRVLLSPGSDADRAVQRGVKLGLRLGIESTPTIVFEKKKLLSNLQGIYLVRIMEDLIHEYHPEKKDLRLSAGKSGEALLKESK